MQALADSLFMPVRAVGLDKETINFWKADKTIGRQIRDTTSRKGAGLLVTQIWEALHDLSLDYYDSDGNLHLSKDLLGDQTATEFLSGWCKVSNRILCRALNYLDKEKIIRYCRRSSTGMHIYFNVAVNNVRTRKNGLYVVQGGQGAVTSAPIPKAAPAASAAPALTVVNLSELPAILPTIPQVISAEILDSAAIKVEISATLAPVTEPVTEVIFLASAVSDEESLAYKEEYFKNNSNRIISFSTGTCFPQVEQAGEASELFPGMGSVAEGLVCSGEVSQTGCHPEPTAGSGILSASDEAKAVPTGNIPPQSFLRLVSDAGTQAKAGLSPEKFCSPGAAQAEPEQDWRRAGARIAAPAAGEQDWRARLAAMEATMAARDRQWEQKLAGMEYLLGALMSRQDTQDTTQRRDHKLVIEVSDRQERAEFQFLNTTGPAMARRVCESTMARAGNREDLARRAVWADVGAHHAAPLAISGDAGSTQPDAEWAIEQARRDAGYEARRAETQARETARIESLVRTVIGDVSSLSRDYCAYRFRMAVLTKEITGRDERTVATYIASLISR